MAAITILEPGPLTTVQDTGRYGFQDRGVPVSGAMDLQAVRVGNRLVGNPEDAAVLEITLGGFCARFEHPMTIAVTGADLGATVDGQPLDGWTARQVGPGNVLRLAGPRLGCRAYLCVTGGIAVPAVMGSRSTYLRGGFGGLEGRAIKAGDALAVGPAFATPIAACPPALIPAYTANPVLRAVSGPQQEAFTEEAIAAFYEGTYTLTGRSDRMGAILEGPVIAHRAGPDIVSDGTVFGSIQVPGTGQPIILMADRQTAGGYAKIATVIGVDLPLVAQLMPGDTVRFAEVGLSQARQLALENAFRLRRLGKKP